MNTDMQRRALAARDAYLALLDLKALVDHATQAAHVAELEAVHLAIRPRQDGDIRKPLCLAMDTLRSARFETTLLQAREKLETAAS